MKPAEACDKSGWDILAAIMLVLALGRLSLEEVIRPAPILIYSFLVLLIAWVSPRVPRPVRNAINTLILLLVAFYGAFNHGPSEISIARAWVWAAAIFAFLIALGQWKGFLEGTRTEEGFPPSLHVLTLTLATLFGIVIYGTALALPVGPLCDEGMILYMEGGCDWGGSNIFFFAKVGLLLAVNAGMSFALRAQVSNFKLFVPHFLVALGLIAVWWNDVSCDLYYDQPQGNLSQMVVETSVLALLLIAGIPDLIDASGLRRLVTVLLLNLWAVAAFYLALLIFPHWTWAHTFTTALFTMIPAALRFSDSANGLAIFEKKT